MSCHPTLSHLSEIIGSTVPLPWAVVPYRVGDCIWRCQKKPTNYWKRSGLDAQIPNDFKSKLQAISNRSDSNHCDSRCDFYPHLQQFHRWFEVATPFVVCDCKSRGFSFLRCEITAIANLRVGHLRLSSHRSQLRQTQSNTINDIKPSICSVQYYRFRRFELWVGSTD